MAAEIAALNKKLGERQRARDEARLARVTPMTQEEIEDYEIEQEERAREKQMVESDSEVDSPRKPDQDVPGSKLQDGQTHEETDSEMARWREGSRTRCPLKPRRHLLWYRKAVRKVQRGTSQNIGTQHPDQRIRIQLLRRRSRLDYGVGICDR